jgi:hypothetical protein
MEKEAKLQYDEFLETGDLNVILPGASGNWEKDKKEFTEAYREYKKVLEKLNIN